MQYFISQKTGGIYLSAVHDDIPADAVEIDADQYAAFKGQQIVWDAKGKPSVFDPSTDKAAITAAIASRRYQAEVAGCRWKEFMIATDRDSQAKIDQADRAVSKGLREDGEGWKCYDLGAEDVVFRPTTNAEISEIAGRVYVYVAACFAREQQLLELVASGKYTPEMLDQDWPS